MRITQYIYKRLQEEYPELFISSEKSEKASALFASFLPAAALGDASQNPWCEFGRRDIPAKRKTILFSFKGLENLSFSELNKIDRLACFLKRAGFKILLSVDDKLEGYNLQLFDRETIKRVQYKSRHELCIMAMNQERLIANDIFFIDETKNESDNEYLTLFNLKSLEIEEERSYTYLQVKNHFSSDIRTNNSDLYILTLMEKYKGECKYDVALADSEGEDEKENTPITLHDYITVHKNIGILRIKCDAKAISDQAVFPVFENLYELSIASAFRFNKTHLFQNSLKYLEKLDSGNYRTVRLLQELDASDCFFELRELSVKKECLAPMEVPFTINAPKLSFLHLGIKGLGETIDLRHLPFLTRLEIEYHAISQNELETHITFLTGVNINLLELSVSRKITTLEKLMPIIENSPNLRRLELDDIFIAENEIQALLEKFPNLLMTINWSRNFKRSKKQIEIEQARSIDREYNSQQNNTVQAPQSVVFEKSALPKSKEIPGAGQDDNFVYQAQSTLQLDFDTQHNPDITHIMRPACKHITQNFPTHFHYTRDFVFRLTEDLEIEEIKSNIEIMYELPSNVIKTKLDLYEFNDSINIKANEKIKLKSLSAHDNLIELSINGKLLKTNEIKITRDNLGFYEVTFLTDVKGQLAYQHDVSQASLNKLEKLPERLQAYIDNIKCFHSSGVESLSGVLITRKRKLMAMYHQRKAACRHRAPVLLNLFSELKKDFPEEYKNIQIRGAQRGGIHINVEISTDAGITWHEEDLGGFKSKTEYTSTILPPIPFSAKTALPHYSFSEMLNRINNELGKNTFLCLKESADRHRCLLQIKKACPHRPVFYVDSPRDLKTLEAGLRLNEERTACRITLAGNLMDFLIEHKAENPLIVINWENFTSLEILKVNSIITGEKRRIGILDIPFNVSIIGLHSKNEKLVDLLCDTSFLSRHISGGVHDFTDITIPVIPAIEAARASKKVLQINLHFSPRWRDMLMGNEIVCADRLGWQEGQLLEAFNDPEINTIELLNPPVNCPEFENFVSDLRVGEPLFSLDQKIKIKQAIDVKIIHNVFNINKQDLKIVKIKNLPDNMFIINASTFEQCLHSKKIDDSGLLTPEKGLIESCHVDSLALCVSSTLSESQWSLLISCAEKFKKKLVIYSLPEVVMPHFLRHIISNGPLVSPSVIKNRFIISSNLRVTLSVLSAELSNPKIIDISEVDIDNLFCKILFKRSKESFNFLKQFSSVWVALMNGETVILKGRISNAMLNYLTTFFSSRPYFMLEGVKHEFPGKLIVVSDDSFAEPSWLHAEIKSEPLLEKKVIPPFKPSVIDPNDLSIEACEIFEKNRLDSVLHLATYSPYVLLEGAPASGKTYFFYTLEKLDNIKIYNEINIREFLTDNFEGVKFLLRDEINLRDTDCSQDSDLLNNTPSIFVEGEYIEAVGKCRILYTQNSLQSGGSRTEQRLFKECPESKIMFEKMHPAFILHRILMPIFKTTFSESESLALAKEILYNSVRTPRDLQTQALFICALKKFPLPDNPPAGTFEVCMGLNGFTLTASRFPQYKQLLTLLAVRRFKRELPIDAPDGARFGGVNGSVFIAAPGLGKSEFITKTLESEAYIDDLITPNTHDEIEVKRQGMVYHPFPPDANEDQMLFILDKAFHEGLILIVDEIDSCPLEKYFNACLTGFDRFGNKAKKAGFTMLCTANGAHNKGRGLLTEPFLSRFLVMEFEEYSRDELIQILQAKFVNQGFGIKYLQETGLKKKLIDYIVDDFLTQQNKQKFETPPTFRELEAFCKKYFENTFVKFNLKLSFEQHQVVIAYGDHPAMQILVNRLLSGEINHEKVSAAELVGILKKTVIAGSLFLPPLEKGSGEHHEPEGFSYSA
ncbi:MAG: hypothetical protein A3E82_01165 [Gammaproteobacteria bacterium RIFCSPHIGHO2_12_FULL_38_11]|nr:MAG: hypothetical protein A3E82_01165 [Gammaproteobacteria bacterium RIFCSPHIGHO2_12_FULL_38_11]